MGRATTIPRFLARTRHLLIYEGLAALVFAVLQLLWLRGLDIRFILLFGLPPFVAVVALQRGKTAAARRLAAAFLISIGVGVIVAHAPALFPRLQTGFPGLPQVQDRLLSWYTGVYLSFVTVSPLVIFARDLWVRRRREPVKFSRFTCILGLFTVGLFLLGLPNVLGLLGFWPIG
jgi:hypothetical protein